jgi:hypothetical protein
MMKGGSSGGGSDIRLVCRSVMMAVGGGDTVVVTL